MEFATPMIHKSGNALHVSHGDDSGLHVEFHTELEHMGFKSEQEGRPVYEEVPFIKIMFPGNKTTSVYRRATDDDKQRFPKHWEVFERQGKQVVTGQPIEEWGPISKSMAATLKAMNIFTVEQLAGAPDTALTWLGARELRDNAIKFLEVTKDAAAVMAVHAENKRLKDDIEIMKAQIKELANVKKS